MILITDAEDKLIETIKKPGRASYEHDNHNIFFHWKKYERKIMSIFSKSYEEIGSYGFPYKDLEKISPLWRHNYLERYCYDLQEHAL